jgi:hypothetical protein
MQNVSIPINIDSFVLCEDSCNGDSRIAPITQPNYMGLRLDSYLIQHDFLEHVDFHSTKPVNLNPRLTDIGVDPPKFLSNRLGAHVHWSLPRCYRTGAADADSGTSQPILKDPGVSDKSQPVFPKVPNRWLLVRHLKSCQPAEKLDAVSRRFKTPFTLYVSTGKSVLRLLMICGTYSYCCWCFVTLFLSDKGCLARSETCVKSDIHPYAFIILRKHREVLS